MSLCFAGGHLGGKTLAGLLYRRQAEEDERRHLLEGRTGVGPSWRVQEDAEAQSMSSIQGSKRALEEMFETGTSILTDMGAQRERLKACRLLLCAHICCLWRCLPMHLHCSLECCSRLCLVLHQAAHRKALDVLNSLGLSDSLLRVIDRRQRLDKWITYGGMVRKYPSCSVIYSIHSFLIAVLGLICAG